MRALVLSALLMPSPSPGDLDPRPSAELPGFELAVATTGDGLAILPVALAGRSLRMAFDSGTSRTLIGAGLADRLGLDPIERFRLSSVQGPPRSGLCGRSPAGPPSLVVGGVVVTLDCLGWVPDEPEVAGASGTDGLLGADLLAGIDLWLDRRHGLARVAPSGSLSCHVRGDRIPIEPIARRPAIRADLVAVGRSHEELRLVLDSGTEALVLFGDRARSAREPTGHRMKQGILATATTRAPEHFGDRASLRVHGHRYSPRWLVLLDAVDDRTENGLVALSAFEPVLLDLRGGWLVARSRLSVARGGCRPQR